MWSTDARLPRGPSARRRREDPVAFIANRAVFGTLHDERFTTPYRAALTSLHERGALASFFFFLR